MDIRNTLTLLEEKNRLEQIRLPYARTALEPVMSSGTIDYHFGKLYKGYVDRYNAGEGDAAFNEAGAYLHGILFSQFRSPKTSQPSGAILGLMKVHHRDFADFKEAFKTEAMKFQGSGWIYLAKNGQIKTIRNHAKRSDIALLVDWWEHAWVLDYQAKKDKYLDAVWRIMDWEAINRRL